MIIKFGWDAPYQGLKEENQSNDMRQSRKYYT